MFESIFSLKETFLAKYLKPVHGPHIVNAKADTDAFKIKVKERLIHAITKGIKALPLLVSDKKKPDDDFEIAHKCNGYYIVKIQYLKRSVYFRSVFWHITKEFPISYTDESAALMDAFFQESRLQDLIEDICAAIINRLNVDSSTSMDNARVVLNSMIENRLVLELDEYFNNNQLLVLCAARAEGVKGSLVFKEDENDKIQTILDKRNFDRPIFEDQYYQARGRYKADEENDLKPYS